jgi:biotin carboxylase
VLKPLASAGSDGVFFAASEAEARVAFDAILGTRNVFGGQNAAVLVQ